MDVLEAKRVWDELGKRANEAPPGSIPWHELEPLAEARRVLREAFPRPLVDRRAKLHS